MTWMKNSSWMDLLKAAKLRRPFGGETRHRGGRWKLPGAIGGVGLGRQAMVAANAEEGMGHHDQSHMPVQPSPEPALIIVQPQFSFGILVEPLDDPPVVGQDHLVLEAPGVQAPGEAVFGLSLLPRRTQTWPPAQLSSCLLPTRKSMLQTTSNCRTHHRHPPTPAERLVGASADFLNAIAPPKVIGPVHPEG